jgi:alpha-tubulin suppressor-like RCC1 family protein
MSTRSKFASCAAAIVALATIASSQSEVVGWGRNRFNSAYNHESFTQVSAGSTYTLALRPDGSIVGWGSNVRGELDIPALPTGLTYVQVSGAKDMWSGVAIRCDGSAVVWGDNGAGQWNVPALPPGQSYVHVAAGSGHIVALRSDGSIVAWGANEYGECNVPALPPGLVYVAVDALAGATLARRSDGAILVFGYNVDGQCNVPALPPGVTYVDAGAGYYHILARRSDGVAVAWGYNSHGQCNVPALPPGLSWVKFTGGPVHSLGLRSDGTLVAWGGNASGQCNVPPLPPGLTYTPQVSAGGYSLVWGTNVDFSSAVRSDGAVLCWGGNDYFECNTPRIPAGLSYAQVSMGGSHVGLPFDIGAVHALTLLSDGSVQAFGRKDEGQCNVPALPSGVRYVEVDAGNHFFSIARRSDGQVVAWGDNTSGQCNVPALPPGVFYAQVDSGDRHALARRSDGAIVAWGDNSYGQCSVPVLSPGVTCVEVAASWRHSLARLSDGSVLAWGSNAHGQCNVPAPPPGVSYVEIAAGCESSLARRSDGTVVAWGDNSLGQCNVPALPPGLTYVEISTDAEFDNGTWARSSSLARRSDGAVVVWGDTGSGQADVPALPPGSSFAELAAGGLCTMARVGAGAPCGDWNLARDFRVSPDQENPNRDICGNPGVWHFLESYSATYPAHDPTTYTLLPDFVTDLLDVPGLESWRSLHLSKGNLLPLVAINNTGSDQSPLGIQWPAGAVLVHPPFDGFAIVGWRSPWTGSVEVAGGVQDVQFGSSDGIGWSIDHYDGLTNTTIASGSIPEMGAQLFQNGSGGSNLARVAVNQGDFLFFLVDPLAWAGADSTRLDIVITPTSPCEPPTNYCVAAINSTGQGAHIASQGSTSIAQNDLTLLVSGCPPNHPGLFFFGRYQTQVQFGEGYLCVTGNQHRLAPILFVDGSGAASYALDFANPGSAASLIRPGEQWNFQFYYRDPQPIAHGFNLSDALHATFCP